MAEADRSVEEILESVGSGSSHRPIGPFGPIPKNSEMEQDETFARTPIVAGEMPRRRSNTSTASAAYHTVQGSGTDGSESAGYRSTSEHRDTASTVMVESLLPSQLAKSYKATSYWSRGDPSSAGSSGSAERVGRGSAERVRRGPAVEDTSGSSRRSEPAGVRPLGAARRDLETAEAMTYAERRSTRGDGCRSSDHERFRNISSSVESSGGERPGFPFRRAENGGMQVTESMVVYQDGNLAVLAADPVHTRLRVHAKERHAKSAGSVTDRMSADIHASYDNLSISQQRQLPEASPGRPSSGASLHSGTGPRERLYETSEPGSQRRQEREAAAYTSRWESESAAHGHSSRHSARAGGGSQSGDRRPQSERSATPDADRLGSMSRRDSGFSFDPCGSLGGSDSAELIEADTSSRRRSLSPRPAASARLSPAEDTPASLRRVLQPADAEGHETEGLTTRFVRQETAESRRAASATTLYMAPTAAGAESAPGRGGSAVTVGAGAGGAVDEAGYRWRASGELVMEDEVCDLEEREEVFSGEVKERLPRHHGDAESSLEKSARRTQDEQRTSYQERAITGGYRYSGASGGQRGKRELGCLAEEAVRSARYDQCCVCRHYQARFERRC